MLRFDGEYPGVYPKATFWRFSVKNCKKSASKDSIEKPILLNFVNLTPTFDQDCIILVVLRVNKSTDIDFGFFGSLFHLSAFSRNVQIY